MMKRNVFLTAALAAGLTFTSANAAEVVLDAIGESATINGALFVITDEQPTGSGVIQPFVRIQDESAPPDGIQQGYNTENQPSEFDEKTEAGFDHTVNIDDLAVIEIGGTDYYQFLLDIGEPGGGNNLISLDALRVYLGSDPDLTGYDPSVTGDDPFDSGDANLVYSLDNGGDNAVTLDGQLNPGNGAGDLFVNIPVASFTGTNEWVYLYSLFGETHAAQGTFEEWAARTGDGNGGPGGGGEPIPTPSAIGMGLLLVGSMFLRRKTG
jgi:hypothetical protein